MYVVLASQSEYKYKIVTEVMIELFGLTSADLTIEGFDIPSGVADYPRSGADLYRGAMNRMAYLDKYYGNADYCVAMQGGAIFVGDAMFESGIVLVRNQIGVVTTGLRPGIPISYTIEDNLHGSLSPMDIVVEQTGKRHDGGYAGYVTNGRLSAYQTYRIATMVAFEAQRLT